METNDLEDIAWSPDGRFIAAWETVLDVSLDHYGRFLICQCHHHLLQYSVYIYYPDGRQVASYSAYDVGLGIKSVRWSPSSQFLAIGSFDQKVCFFWLLCRGLLKLMFFRVFSDTTAQLLHMATFDRILTPERTRAAGYSRYFQHCLMGARPLTSRPSQTVFKETDPSQEETGIGITNWSQATRPKIQCTFSLLFSYSHIFTGNSCVLDEIVDPPITIPESRIDPDKPNPKLGVGICDFNIDGRMMVTRNGVYIVPHHRRCRVE